MSQESQDLRPGKRSAFVGREAELAALSAIFDEVLGAPRCALVALTGEAGIGKSRLVDQFSATAAAAGGRIAWGACWEGDVAPSLWPWLQVARACRDLLPQTAPPFELFDMLEGRQVRAPGTDDDVELSRFRLFDAVRRLVETVLEAGPLMVVVEDLQAADRSSALLLSFLARHIRTRPLLLLTTYRHADGTRADAEVARVVADVGYRFRLRGLGLEELGVVVGDTLGREPPHELIERIHGLSGGNPLFARELARASTGDLQSVTDERVSPGVREVTRRRLAAFSPDARWLAEIASVVGRDFDPRLLELQAADAGIEVDAALERLVDDELVAELGVGSGVYRFSHALVREAIYGSISRNRRRGLHRAIGQALQAGEDRQPSAVLLPLLAHHFAAAGSAADLRTAIELWIAAGAAARSQAAFDSACECWRAALELMATAGAPDEERARLLERLGHLLCVTGIDHPAGVHALERALTMYAQAGLDQQRASVHARLGAALSTFPESFALRAASEHFRAAESLLTDAGSDRRLAMVQLGVAGVAVQQMATETGAEAAARCKELALRIGDQGLWATASAVGAMHTGAAGRLVETFSELEHARTVANQIGLPAARFTTAWMECTLWFVLGDPRELQTAGAAQLELLSHAPARAATMNEFRAHALALRGRIAEATQELGRVENPQFFARPSVEFAAGDWNAARATLRRFMARDQQAGNHIFECFDRLLLARICRAERRYEAAVELLNRCLASALRAPQRLVEAWCRSELALALCCAGRLGECRAEITKCRELIDQPGFEARRAIVDLAEAVALAKTGHPEAASALAQQALSAIETIGLPFEEAEAHMIWADGRRACTDTAGAERSEARAAEILKNIGAAGDWSHLLYASDQPTSSGETFIREGDFWTIRFAGQTALIKHVKGLSFIAELLSRPGEDVHVLDLVSLIEDDTAHTATRQRLGDAGPALDARAKAEYRRRLSELADELAQAEAFHDLGRTAMIQAEIDAITDELARAIGLGGRDRRAASASERARVSVTKRISSALTRIQSAHPALAEHLAATLRTGGYCSYQPDSRIPTSWQVSLTSPL